MREDEFKSWCENVYAAQGKPITSTSAKVVFFAFRKVGHLPAAFFEWAAKELEEYPGLPDKLWQELQKVLFPRWLAATGKGRRESCCADCDTATPGFFTAWKHDGTGYFHRFICKCACNRSNTLKGEDSLTKAEARRRGYVVMTPGCTNAFEFEMKELYGHTRPERTDRSEEMVEAAMQASDEIGEDHAAYMEAEEYV